MASKNGEVSADVFSMAAFGELGSLMDTCPVRVNVAVQLSCLRRSQTASV
jgi:hypothetical protein